MVKLDDDDAVFVFQFFFISLLVYVFSLQVFYAFFLFIKKIIINISSRLDPTDLIEFNWWVNLSWFWKVIIFLLVVILFNIYWWLFVFEVPTPT